MSRRPDAKTVKISEESLNKLKHVKENILKESSYSQAILIMSTDIEDNKKKGIKHDIPFVESESDEAKDKTIVLSRDAHVFLNNIKYDQNLKTISDAIEFLCRLYSAYNSDSQK